MKKNLIKAVLFWVLLQTQLFSSGYEWSASVSKSEAYVNEAIHLQYICRFQDRAELYAIEFDPISDDALYTIQLLSKDEKIEDGKKISTYDFIAHIHQSGVTQFNFDVAMKKTNKDSIENTVIGRDNGAYAEYETKIIKQKELTVTVHEHNSTLVGELVMEVKKDTPDIKAYSPYHMQIILSGKANFDLIKAFEFEIEGVKILSEEPQKNIKLTKEGYEGVWSQKFVFVATKDFTIPKLTIVYFDAKNAAIKELFHEQTAVSVLASAFKQEELLDEIPESFVFEKEYLYYLLTFIAGFLFAKIKIKLHKENKTPKDILHERIKNAASLDALCMILALEDAKKYESLILKIETKEFTSLQEAKRLIIKGTL
ncbi:MAG TPA: hypothetical protein CFH84_06290 [Sulfurimonas sp. UBA12504]|nr:MAG: hypothetical protein A2019_05805 [Sulfurimonas sp. GWF2_37_8]DAB30021.1 MAG TPA: hypothetical protein CFH84_06290 [Sulfurimonas sp. UBA12504]